MSTDTDSSDMTDGGDAPETIQIGATAAGEPVTCPLVDVLTGRTFVTGRSGSGKSNTASVVVEELLAAGQSCLIVDTDGEYYGLKESYEVLHVGATDECDLQVGPDHADKLAGLALEERVPVVLDVSGFVDSETVDTLVRDTARALFEREHDLRRPFLLVVEEIHEYVPEGGGLDDVGEELVRIGKRGRKRGLGLAGISQRPADVKKDFITQCDWLVWHRLTWDNDTDVVRRVIDADAADAVDDLADGEALLQADWLDVDAPYQRVQIRRKQTYDAGATPGLDDAGRPELTSIGEDLQDELEAISEREAQRRSEVERLEARLDEKDERIEELEAELKREREASKTLDVLMERLERGGGDAEGGDAQDDVAADLQARLEERNADLADVREELDAVREERDALQERVDELDAEIERLERAEERVEYAERVEEQLDRAREVLGVEVEQAAAGSAAAGEDERNTAALRDELADARERIDELEATNDRLRAEAGDGESLEPLASYEAFLDDEAVREAIEEAKGVDRTSPRYIKGVVATIVDEGGWVSYDDVAERLDLATTGEVSKAASVLEARQIVEKEKRDGQMHVDLNVDGLNEVREAAARREKTTELMERF
jgi:predicted  nucleic acid-binding Zn-ribbon protein